MNTLYVTSHRAKVGRQKGALMVRDPDVGQTRVPMETLDAVVLLGQAQLTNQAMTGCVHRGIRITSLNRSGSVRFVVGGAVHGNVLLRRAQHRAVVDERHRTTLARTLVAGKLQNARKTVQRWARDANGHHRGVLRNHQERVESRLQAVEGTTELDRLRGIEGDGSRHYFRAMAVALRDTPFVFTARRRRPPRDPVNALLGFVYGLVGSELRGALESVGLDPQIGFLHEPRPGRNALALDLLEELRTGHADRFSTRLLRRGELAPDDFQLTAGGATYLTETGRKAVLARYESFRGEEIHHVLLGRTVERWALPHVQATILARHLRGDLTSYAPFVISG